MDQNNNNNNYNNNQNNGHPNNGPMDMPPMANQPVTTQMAQAKTNTMAILSLVSAFIFPLMGVIFGAISLNQIKKTGEDGRGLAIAGLITSSIFTLIGFIYVVIAVMAVISAASSSSY